MSAPSDRDPAGRRPPRHPDVGALVCGLLAVAVAGYALWSSLIGPVDAHAVQVGAPVLLVVAGIVGLVLSRDRTP